MLKYCWQTKLKRKNTKTEQKRKFPPWQKRPPERQSQLQTSLHVFRIPCSHKGREQSGVEKPAGHKHLLLPIFPLFWQSEEVPGVMMPKIHNLTHRFACHDVERQVAPPTNNPPISAVDATCITRFSSVVPFLSVT